jgi:phage head maturation protease
VSLGPIEYGDGGYVIAVDSKSLRQYKARSRTTAFRYEPKVVEGFACLYLKPHIHKGRIEVHERGCFNETLSTKQRVDLCIDHDDSYSLGNTDDNLELIDTPKGLAFRLRVKSQDDLDRL